MILILTLPLLFAYTACLALMLVGLLKRDRPRVDKAENGSDPLPGISIVIPFKNEAENLPGLLGSLAVQEYDGPVEVLLVNDGSTDGYEEAISAWTGAWTGPGPGTPTAPRTQPPAVRVIDSVFEPQRRLTSKQQALDLGIRSAAFDLIAFTDADMVLDPAWLATLALSSANGARLVFGHTVIPPRPGRTLLDWFQSFQLELLFAVAWILSRLGIAGSCMGNNLLISKQAYLSVGGHDAVGYTIVEDRALLAAFAKKGLRIAATEPFAPSADTLPCPSLRQYSQQLLRWAYGGFSWNANVTLLAIPQVAQTLLLAAALVGLLPGLPSAVALFNFFVSWVMYALAFRKMRSPEQAILYPAFFVLMIIETLWLLAAFIFKRPVTWKGRRI